MNDEIEKRCKEIAQYIIRENATVRKTAEVFGISKSTVHKDVVERLPTVDSELAKKVRKVLNKNKEERHIRGGVATRRKFRMMKE